MRVYFGSDVLLRIGHDVGDDTRFVMLHWQGLFGQISQGYSDGFNLFPYSIYQTVYHKTF